VKRIEKSPLPENGLSLLLNRVGIK